MSLSDTNGHIKVACIQFSAGPDWQSHAEDVSQKIRLAAQMGAQLIALPENVSGIRAQRQAPETVPVEGVHPAVQAMQSMAQHTSAWISCGSLAVRPTMEHKLPVNRSLLFAPSGEIMARYDKIHLFEALLPNGETFNEGEHYTGGSKAVLHSIGGGINLGLSICYDVRFGALYRTLAQNGANILLVPSAFTVPTGEAHWHTLLRARAIENGCYVVAAAQCGTHDGGRKTYGHSLIIDPWGRVLADGGDAPGIIMADINLAEVVKARTAIPSLRGDRPFSL